MTREEAILWLNEELRTWENECQSKHPIKEALYVACKALEQEPCEDAVSVTSVFEIMGNLLSIPYDFDRSITEKDVSESMDKIRELPRVTPQESRWIPVSERMPKPNRLVLCYITTNATETYFLALWNDTLNAWEEGIGGYRLLENDLGYEVIAWMPLPEPYKAESEGK